MNAIEKVIVVSNFPDDGGGEEDVLLTKSLRAYIPSRTEDVKTLSVAGINKGTAYLFRCIYDEETGTVETNLSDIYNFLDRERIIYRNTFNGKGDQCGKSYLVSLYKEGRLVVPTFNSVSEALEYPALKYVIKPVFAGSAKGQKMITRQELQHSTLDQNGIIQPKLDVKYEVSYIFIDDEFQYATKTSKSRWDQILYEPTKKELGFASSFTQWNPIKGIQRIDCLKTNDDKEYLLEVEDWCPFLSLYATDGVPRERFVANLVASMKIS